jgi:hypothetical protein
MEILGGGAEGEQEEDGAEHGFEPIGSYVSA